MVKTEGLTEKEQALAEIDEGIKIAKSVIKRRDDLDSLFLDERFQNVILDGYLEVESKRIFELLIDPTHNLKRDVMENLMDKMTSVRNVKQYFRVIKQSGNAASEQLDEAEQYRIKINSLESIIDVVEE